MLTLARVRGPDGRYDSEFRLTGTGFLAAPPSGGDAASGFAASYVVAAGVGQVQFTDTILVAGFIEFQVMYDLAGAICELDVLQVNPETMATDRTDVVGNGAIQVNNIQTFGARSAPAVLTDRVFAIFRLQWKNTNAGSAGTVTNVRLWGSAA